MKTNALLAFFFFVALFFFTRAEFVYDSRGHIVLNGGIYSLMSPLIGGPAIIGAIIEKTSGSCSLAVVEKLYESNSTKIECPNPEPYITTDSPLRISFDPWPIYPEVLRCTKDPEWLVEKDAEFRENAVMVGYPEEFPTPLHGWFYFRPHDSGNHNYTLVFRYESGHFGNVSAMTDSHENRRLYVTESPTSLVLKLVKKDSDFGASHISMVV